MHPASTRAQKKCPDTNCSGTYDMILFYDSRRFGTGKFFVAYIKETVRCSFSRRRLF